MSKKTERICNNQAVEGALLLGTKSDSELLILTENPEKLLEDKDLEKELKEIKFRFVNHDWIQLNPIVEETIDGLRGGYKILYDPHGLLAALCWKFSKLYGNSNDERIDIDSKLARRLVDQQFPEFKNLDLEPVETAGWCNGPFKLGEDYLVKIPRAKRYERGHLNEAEALPKISDKLNLPVSSYVALGNPSHEYPWHWSILKWIEGDIAENLAEEFKVDFARDLAAFLRNLWSIKAVGGPRSFEQNFYRGGPLYVYDEESREAMEALKDELDYISVKATWEQSLKSSWNQDLVWVHGDLFPANILIQNNRLHAVIDFESMCVGDPSCDLALTWTFFEGDSREKFIEELAIDQKTWERARGWALWKALISLASMEDKKSVQAIKRKKQIQAIIQE